MVTRGCSNAQVVNTAFVFCAHTRLQLMDTKSDELFESLKQDLPSAEFEIDSSDEVLT